MDVIQAIQQRRSIRKYLPEPVPQSIVKAILDTARWSPSGTNTQSWGVTAVFGQAVEKLGEAIGQAATPHHSPHPDTPYPPYYLEYKDRQRAVGYKVYEAKGIAREDKPKRLWWAHEGLRFFHAPAVVILHTPRLFTPYTLVDCGIFAMAVMLAAEARGLGSCPMTAPCEYPDVIKATTGIPETQVLAMTIALGYPDMRDPVNQFPRDREPVDTFTRFLE